LREDGSGQQNRRMHLSSAHPDRVAPKASSACAVAALFVNEYDRDLPRVAIPRPAVQIVVRFGPSARDGLDVHAFGVQRGVRRKLIRAGQRAVMASLHPGTSKAVLGVAADAIAGQVIELDDLWGRAATQRLLDQLASTRVTSEAAEVLESAIAARAVISGSNNRLVLEAAERLASAGVNIVATDLGVSERHLRRVFREAVGVSPKEFARLVRFNRALRAAHEDDGESWASIAVAAGYYDQAHLIGEFHSISGVTPRALLSELRAGS
jgi:AraC-like DNA-binding protein